MDFLSIQPDEIRTDMDDFSFSGYAAAWGEVPSYQEVLHKGAFKKTIKERFKRGMIKVLRDHETPIGIPVELNEDDTGLFAKATVSKTPFGEETMILIRDGVYSHMSIGFSPVKFDYFEHPDNGDLWRNLREVKLYEYSPVLFPANENAAITAVRSMNEIFSGKAAPEDKAQMIKFMATMIEYLKSLTIEKNIQPDEHGEKSEIEELRSEILSLRTAVCNALGIDLAPGNTTLDNSQPQANEHLISFHETLKRLKGE